jgi:GH35 family endo-1,4-beta-xylanase
LGGTGTTGFDWIITAFKMARQRWPKAILIYNDYNTVEWGNEITWIKMIIPKLIAAGAPIDAVGFQAHGLKGTTATTLKTRLDDIANAIKVPMYITEYDIGETDDAKQKDNFAAHIPVMWAHPKVAGITIWGYITGKTWVNGTGIMSDAGAERPAMVWLKDYIAKNMNPPAPKVGPTVGIAADQRQFPARTVSKRPTMIVKNTKGRLMLGVEQNGQIFNINGRRNHSTATF